MSTLFYNLPSDFDDHFYNKIKLIVLILMEDCSACEKIE